MKEPIDWKKVDEEFDRYINKEKFVNEQITNERKKEKSCDELIEEAKIVNEIIEKNNLHAKIIVPKKGDKE